MRPLTACILLLLPFSNIFSQEQNPGIIRPGDVIFEDPLLALSPPSMNDYDYSKILLQDSKGFLWFVYQGSLFRYDGYELRDFMKTPLGPNDLKGNNISCMIEDEFGYIWIGSHLRIGLYRYDPGTEKMESFPRYGRMDPADISNAEIWCISPAKNGKIWIGTTGYGTGCGLYCYDYQTDSITSYRHVPDDPESLPWDAMQVSHVDQHNKLWIKFLNIDNEFLRSPLYHFDPEAGKFTEFRLYGEKFSHIIMNAWNIYEDEEGYMYMNLRTAEDEYYPASILVKVSSNPESIQIDSISGLGYFMDYEIYLEDWQAIQLTLDKEGKIWANGGIEGVSCFNPETKQVSRFRSYDPIYGRAYFLGNILRDSSGIIWHSYHQGLKHFIPWKRKFTSYNRSFLPNLQSENIYISAVFEEENGILWLGMNEYLVKYDPVSRTHRTFSLPKINTMMANRMKVIKSGGPGVLYIGAENCMYIFRTDTYEFEVIEYPVSEQWNRAVSTEDLLLDNNGIIWVGTSPGCVKIDLNRRSSEYMFKNYIPGQSFTGGITFAILKDKFGYIWLGTLFGLNRYDPRTEENLKIIHDPMNPDGLAAERISDLLMDSKGNLWISYEANGISFLESKYITADQPDPGSLRFTHFSREDGLPDLFISNLVEDKSGNIWFSSDNGISMIDPLTREVVSYNSTDGIDIQKFTSDFHLNPETGMIYIGGLNGMISFHPENMPRNTYVPPVVFTELHVNDREVPISDSSVLKRSITYTENLDLSSRENFLRFKFAALDYTCPEKNQYRYFMDGVDRDTIYAGSDRIAEYRDLAPGKYTFWVSGSNSDGLWNTKGVSMGILIRPPWYRTIAAFTGYILLFVSAVLLYIRFRTERFRREEARLLREVERQTRQLRQKNEQILEMESLKTRFFTDISHEIRTPVSLISGPLDNLISRENRDPKEMEWLKVIRRNSQRLVLLINQLLDITRLDTGYSKLILRESDIIRHLRILVSEYSSLGEHRNIVFDTDIPETVVVTLYDPEKLEKITTNLLGNAFKYTPENGRVYCRVKVLPHPLTKDSTSIRIFVADNGPGISREEQERIFERYYRSEANANNDAGGTGIGLALTNELVKKVHGTIYLRSIEGKGTVFIVTLPLGTAHLEKEEYIIRESLPEILSDTREEHSKQERPSEEIIARELEVMVVEDNRDLRIYLRESLAAEYIVTEAKNGVEGIELAQLRIPDLIITDVMMPDMDGMELCKQLKSDERTSHIPVIMLTAKSTENDKISGLETGADDYIFKPFSIGELKARIRNLLEQRERLRNKYAGMIGLDWGELTLTTLDEVFMKKTLEAIAKNLHDFDFNVEVLSERMAISRGHLFRKLKALTGESPVDLIRIMRLKAAESFLRHGEKSVTQVALSVGFSNLSYFSRCFKIKFGQTPDEYRRSFV